MRAGIVTPVVFQLPGMHAAWEAEAGIDELARIAEEADRLGYHHLTCSDHVAVPEHIASQRGGVYWDPLSLFGFLAALTGRIRLATNVLVLGYHHPLEIAKRYGTLDLISGGRLVLGLGVGTLEEEFRLLAAPFSDRGVRADDALRALRASLSRRLPAYHGQFYDYEGFVVEPCAVQERVPLWIGGKTRLSLRRAVALADGWTPTALTVGQVGQMLGSVELPAGFEVIVGPDRPFDAVKHPSRVTEQLEQMAEAGVTTVNAVFVHHSHPHYLEQLDAFAALSPPGG